VTGILGAPKETNMAYSFQLTQGQIHQNEKSIVKGQNSILWVRNSCFHRCGHFISERLKALHFHDMLFIS